MSIIISNMSIPPGCQKCKFFKKHLFGNGLDYSYSCILGAKDFPMPWIKQMEERASDCPIESLEQGSKMGHWIYELEDWNKWTCSECGWHKRTDIHVKLGYKYCPNCGAKMVEPQER